MSEHFPSKRNPEGVSPDWIVIFAVILIGIVAVSSGMLLGRHINKELGRHINKELVDKPKIDAISTLTIDFKESPTTHYPAGPVTVTDSTVRYIDTHGHDVYISCLSHVTITAAFGKRGVYAFPATEDNDAPAAPGIPKF